MHVTHSRALAAAVLALSTCAGATRLSDERVPPPPAVVASLDGALQGARATPADALAPLAAGQIARRTR
ncbi:MAG: hypothetical protein ACJ8AO_06615 [Gemmatimonadaceae bacterium]